MEGIIITWLVFSFVIAFIGSDRKIGYFGTLLLSLFLSPVIGAVFALASERVPKKESGIQSQNMPKEGVTLYSDALKEHKKGNYELAIGLLNKALNFNPNSRLVLISLSVCYSGLKNKEKGFYFLEKAVANGYSNFKYIQEQKDLKFLRNLPEFKEFVENGYKLPEKMNVGKDNSTDNINKLEKLAQLKEKGILTDEEFEKEKKKILNSE